LLAIKQAFCNSFPVCTSINSQLLDCVRLDKNSNILLKETRRQGLLMPLTLQLFFPSGQMLVDADFINKRLTRFASDGSVEEILNGEHYLRRENQKTVVECDGLNCISNRYPILAVPDLSLQFGDILFVTNLNPYSGRQTSWFTHVGVVISKDGEPLRLLGNDLFENLSESSLSESFMNPWAYMALRSEVFSRKAREFSENSNILSRPMRTCTELVAGVFYTIFKDLKRSEFEKMYPDLIASDILAQSEVLAFSHPMFSEPQKIIKADSEHRKKLMLAWQKITAHPEMALANLLLTDFPLQPLIYRPDLLEALLRYATTDLYLNSESP